MEDVQKRRERQKRYLSEFEEIRGIRVPKEKAPKIKAHAAAKGMSVNAYINALIDADMGTNQG